MHKESKPAELAPTKIYISDDGSLRQKLPKLLDLLDYYQLGKLPIVPVSRVKVYVLGTRVRVVRFGDEGCGVIRGVNSDGSYNILMEDGSEERSVPPKSVKLV